MENFLKNSSYGLEEVHNLNMYLKSLPETNCDDEEEITRIFELSLVKESKEDLNNILKNSPSYLKAIEEIESYGKALVELKNISFKKERLLDEVQLTPTLYLERYSFLKEKEVWDYCEEFYVTKKIEHFFYVTGGYADKKVLLNPKELIQPYIKKGKFKDEDLIQQVINYNKSLLHENNARIYCQKVDISFEDFCSVFDYELAYCEIYESKRVIYKEKRYYLQEVKQLIEEYKVAKEGKYVEGDNIVNYPRYMKYIDFKETQKEKLITT
jgi:hypothetical protein